MFRKMLKSKIHRARITHANVDYEGSITIPPHLLDAANMLPFEAVAVWNVTSGTRFETYIIEGEENSNAICVNGAAAHLVNINDIIIIASFTLLNDKDIKDYCPKAVFVDSMNKIVNIRTEVPEALT